MTRRMCQDQMLHLDATEQSSAILPALSAAPRTFVPDFNNDNTLLIKLPMKDVQEEWFVHGVSLRFYCYCDKNIIMSNTGRLERRKEKLRITCKSYPRRG